jgi:hypothetical protein
MTVRLVLSDSRVGVVDDRAAPQKIIVLTIFPGSFPFHNFEVGHFVLFSWQENRPFHPHHCVCCSVCSTSVFSVQLQDSSRRHFVLFSWQENRPFHPHHCVCCSVFSKSVFSVLLQDSSRRCVVVFCDFDHFLMMMIFSLVIFHPSFYVICAFSFWNVHLLTMIQKRKTTMKMRTTMRTMNYYYWLQ